MSIDPSLQKEHEASIKYEQSVYNFLLDKGIVKTYPYQWSKFDNSEQDVECEELIKQYTNTLPSEYEKNSANLTKEEMANLRFYNLLLSHDISVRLDAIQLRKQLIAEFYPAVRTNVSYSFKTVTKSNVIQFLLNDIPEPDVNTPWEQIIDFRTDEELRNKYLALINWINRVSNSSMTMNEIQEQYEYLYNDYMKHFKLHNLKYHNTVLELLVNIGAGILQMWQSGMLLPAVKNLFEMKLAQIKLTEEEAKMPGKEVAYIYHTKQRFDK